MSATRLVDDYLKQLALQGKDTYNIKYALKLYENYLDKTKGVMQISLKDAEDFQGFLMTEINKEGVIRYAKATVSNLIGAVSGYYAYLKQTKQLLSNPFTHIRRVKRSKALPKHIPDEESLNRFLKQLSKFNSAGNLYQRKQAYRAHVLAELLYSTGIRINEAASLTTGDIDFLRGIIRVADSKSGTERQVIIGEYAQKVLQVYLTMRDYLVHKNGNNYLLFGSKRIKDSFNKTLAVQSNIAGLKSFTSHYFRHAVGYHFLRAGCDIRYIQELLGHKKLSTTQIYTKVNKEDLKNVIDRYHPRTFSICRSTKEMCWTSHSTKEMCWTSGTSPRSFEKTDYNHD